MTHHQKRLMHRATGEILNHNQWKQIVASAIWLVKATCRAPTDWWEYLHFSSLRWCFCENKWINNSKTIISINTVIRALQKMVSHNSKSNSNPDPFNFANTSFSNLWFNSGVKCSFQLPTTPLQRNFGPSILSPNVKLWTFFIIPLKVHCSVIRLITSSDSGLLRNLEIMRTLDWRS